LTVALEQTVRVLRVAALGARRGPATEARTLYDDLSPDEANGTGFRDEAAAPTGPEDEPGR
ncbi:RNA-binding S4 domain-containing protein, partial [Hansschlegelia beijingensis]